MAAAERIRDLAPQSDVDETISRALIEEVFTGYDVNLTATHMAATTLGLLSPTTQFRNMKIGRTFLGVDNTGDAHLGSLEFLDRQPMLMPWPNAAQTVTQVDTGQEMAAAEPADLVIMNPPFTRDSLRHDQFSKSDEKKIKDREKALFANKPVHLSSNGNVFLALSEYITKSNSGAVAAVLPLVTATNASSLDIRRFLAGHFHIETIITSHDPERIYFSENTSIGEILLCAVAGRMIEELNRPRAWSIWSQTRPRPPMPSAWPLPLKATTLPARDMARCSIGRHPKLPLAIGAQYSSCHLTCATSSSS